MATGIEIGPGITFGDGIQIGAGGSTTFQWIVDEANDFIITENGLDKLITEN
jgi:hypothetical protein